MKFKIAVAILLSIFGSLSYRQITDSLKIVDFSGIVVEGDSLFAIPGAFLYVPNTTRGTTTSLVGYFNFPVLAGDTIIIAGMGYTKQHFVIPDTTGSYSLVIRLESDGILLPEVSISSFPSEKVFKEVFLALEIDTRAIDNMNNNLNAQILSRILANSDIEPSTVYKYYMNQQVQAIETQYMMQSTNFLNPFAWAQFIDSLKRK
jgi:hypothetical protein